MKNEETITREEATTIFKQMAADIRQGALNEIEVLKQKLFVEAPGDQELYMIWTMASSSIDYIKIHLEDTLDDIEKGCYLPKQEVTA